MNEGVELNLLKKANKSPSIQILPRKQAKTLDLEKCEPGDGHSIAGTATKELCLSWVDLSYTIPKDGAWLHFLKKWINNQHEWKNKTILHQQSGYVKKGEMVVIIGRSGSGKSTLLECLSGCKVRNRSGQVKIGFNTIPDQVNVCYLPQSDHLIPTLTVGETLRFASKLRNLKVNSGQLHGHHTDRILKDLNLTGCSDVLVKRISGGQRKRLSIGLELLGKPDIFMLDEPTSGLDSSNALHLVNLLHKLTQPDNQSLAIIASMHQPSAKILHQFDRVYLLSHDGRLIYFGPPGELITHVAKFDLHCPMYHNPGDFAIEIASGDFGQDKIEALENDVQANQHENLSLTDSYSNHISIREVIGDMLSRNRSRFSHFWTLLNRTLLTTIRDPSLNYFRLIQHILIGIIVVLLYSDSVGGSSGCLNQITSLDDLRDQERLTTQNMALMFFSLMFLTFAAMMPTVMVFPMEMSVLSKERKNGWYSCASFYLAKTLADLPYQLCYTLIYVIMMYFGTGQLASWWRFGFFLAIAILISLIGQSIGLLFGAIFTTCLQTAIFVAPVSTLPLILISGFFVRINTIPQFLRPITYTSYLKYAFEAMIVTIYGYGRCTLISSGEKLAESAENGCMVVTQFHQYLRNDLNISFENMKEILSIYADENANSTAKLEQFAKRLESVDLNVTNQVMDTLNSTQSLVMTEYELVEGDFLLNIVALAVFVVIIRIITYFVLLHKSERKI